MGLSARHALGELVVLAEGMAVYHAGSRSDAWIRIVVSLSLAMGPLRPRINRVPQGVVVVSLCPCVSPRRQRPLKLQRAFNVTNSHKSKKLRIVDPVYEPGMIAEWKAVYGELLKIPSAAFNMMGVAARVKWNTVL
jgi:hypothetical protein